MQLNVELQGHPASHYEWDCNEKIIIDLCINRYEGWLHQYIYGNTDIFKV